MATDKTTTSGAVQLLSYEDVLKQAEQCKDRFKDKAVYTEVKRLLTDINDFCTKYKIECQYRLALSKDTKQLSNGGVELGKVKLAKSLVSFLMTKGNFDKSKQGEASKPTMNQLFAMLLKHQKFNVVMTKKLIRVKFPNNIKFK